MLESPVLVAPSVDLNRIYLHTTKRTVCEATEMKKKKKKKKIPHTPKPHPPARTPVRPENSRLPFKAFYYDRYLAVQECYRFTIQQNNSLSNTIAKISQCHISNKRSLRYFFCFVLSFFVFALTIYDSWVCENGPSRSRTVPRRRFFSLHKLRKDGMVRSAVTGV